MTLEEIIRWQARIVQQMAQILEFENIIILKYICSAVYAL
jgi:hypothetical protein